MYLVTYEHIGIHPRSLCTNLELFASKYLLSPNVIDAAVKNVTLLFNNLNSWLPSEKLIDTNVVNAIPQHIETRNK